VIQHCIKLRGHPVYTQIALQDTTPHSSLAFHQAICEPRQLGLL
jgi:hypothetical protein